MHWKVEVSNKFYKQFTKVDKKYHAKILSFLESLGESYFPAEFDVLKLKGFDDFYRCRIGDYRIIYKVMKSIIYIEVLEIAHRKDVYK